MYRAKKNNRKKLKTENLLSINIIVKQHITLLYLCVKLQAVSAYTIPSQALVTFSSI